MKTFRNTAFTRRDYECTNIVACQTESAPAGQHWEECDESILDGLDQLWIESGVRYFGYM